MDDETHQMNPICSQQLDVVWWGFLFYTKVRRKKGEYYGKPQPLKQNNLNTTSIPKMRVPIFWDRDNISYIHKLINEK